MRGVGSSRHSACLGLRRGHLPPPLPARALGCAHHPASSCAGMDPYRPDQATPVPNFFLAGSYTKQDYIDSMEGATLSGRQCAIAIIDRVAALTGSSAAQKQAAA